MKPIIRMQLVTLTLPSTANNQGASFAFPDVPRLNGTIITGVEAFTASWLAFTTDGLAVIPDVDAASVMVTLNQGSDQRIWNQPYSDMVAFNYSGIWHEYDPFPIDWQKSKVNLVNAVNGPVSLAFNFHYMRPEDAMRLYGPEWTAKYFPDYKPPSQQ